MTCSVQIFSVNHHCHQVVLVAGISLTPPLAIHPYQGSILVSPLDCIQYPHRAEECMSLLVGQPSFAHVKKFKRERHFLVLQRCPSCFARIIGKFCEMGSKWQYSCCLKDITSRICSKQYAESLQSSHVAFFSKGLS